MERDLDDDRAAVPGLDLLKHGPKRLCDPQPPARPHQPSEGKFFNCLDVFHEWPDSGERQNLETGDLFPLRELVARTPRERRLHFIWKQMQFESLFLYERNVRERRSLTYITFNCGNLVKISRQYLSGTLFWGKYRYLFTPQNAISSFSGGVTGVSCD